MVLIHYSRAPCRKRHMLAMLRRLGLPWQPPRLQLAENLDADDLTPSFLTRCVTRQLCAPIERTQVSCTANHMYAWHLAARTGWETTLFIEDDAELPDRFLPQLRQRLSTLSPGWMILNFGCPEAAISAPARDLAHVATCSLGLACLRSETGPASLTRAQIGSSSNSPPRRRRTIQACAQRRWLRPTPENART